MNKASSARSALLQWVFKRVGPPNIY